MKLTVEKLNDYIVQYVKGHLIPNAKLQTTKFKLGFALGTGAICVNPAMVENAKALGIADENGNIDIDLLKKATNSGMEAAGDLRIDPLGMNLERADIDKFFRLVETGAIS